MQRLDKNQRLKTGASFDGAVVRLLWEKFKQGSNTFYNTIKASLFKKSSAMSWLHDNCVIMHH